MAASTLEKRVKDLEKGKVDKTGAVIQGNLVLFNSRICQQNPAVNKESITNTNTFLTQVVYDNQARSVGRELSYEQLQCLYGQTSPSVTANCMMIRRRMYTAIPSKTTFTEIRNSVWSDGSSAMATQLIQPMSNNQFSLGTATAKWTEIFATTGSINTSDERHKANITEISDAVLDAWAEVQFAQYQFNASIEEKGSGRARIHSGLVAQRIKAVFEAHGLDAFRYGLLCHDEWSDQYDVDDDGERVLAIPAGDLYSLRYEECLCVEAAYQRRRADRIEARLAALETKLGVV